jgi:adenylosuccinate lyase
MTTSKPEPTPSPYDTYSSPLASRNASKQMLELWSPRHKFNTWRRIWLAVAEAQCEMTNPRLDSKGAPSASSGSGPTTKPLVTREQVEELRAVVERPGGITDDEIRAAERYERELRHDVMAHVHALGDSCPKAKGIIHLGMTSQDVVCNADLATLDDARYLVVSKLQRAIGSLGHFAEKTRSIPTLGFTHYQPAQPVTVGRRAAGWAYELGLCRERVEMGQPLAHLRGLRGATGTQASFLALNAGQSDAVDRLEFKWYIAFAGGFRGCTDVSLEPGVSCRTIDERFSESTLGENVQSYLHRLTGQTYPRVIDTFILADLASTASVLHKIATDIRLLCNRKEIDEPFEDKQIGSSAMPYKRNPMRCERICGLTRFVMNLVGNAYHTAATQWLERTLDDSSNRRLSLPEAFLALDGALDLMHNVASGLIVHEAMVRKNLMAELPFMATENILMACVKLGADRQEYHEVIRQHAQAAGMRVKSEGLDNDLLDRLKADPHFQSAARGGKLSAELDWHGVMDPMNYIGRSVEQTERFINEVVEPLRSQYGERIAAMDESGPRV